MANAFTICHYVFAIRFSVKICKAAAFAIAYHSPTEKEREAYQWQMANADFGMNWQSGSTEITMKNTGSESRENLGQSTGEVPVNCCA